MKMVVNSRIICMGALKIYKHLQKKKYIGSSPAETFAASKGWFDKFQKSQHLLHAIKTKGDAGSGEGTATHDFADESFTPHKSQQVFNLDETSLLEMM
jgi:hypothetical protein